MTWLEAPKTGYVFCDSSSQCNGWFCTWRILGECLLISSLPGKALRTHVDIARLATCVLNAKPGKLDIKRREPGILFISLPIVSIFKLAIMT